MANLSRLDIARIIGELEEVSIPADGLIFAEDVTADGVYLLPSGGGTNGRLWKLPRERCEQLVRERPTLEAPSATLRGRSTLWRIVAAIIALGVPLALWPLQPPVGLSPAGTSA